MSLDGRDRHSIDARIEKFLSSRYQGNIDSEIFYGFAYRYHPGTYSEVGFSPENDPNSTICGIDMGDKSLFKHNPDIVTIGCSFTQMADLPYSFNWPRIIELTQGLVVNNCSQSSTGINFQIPYAVDAMKKYGFPKKIYALFPNLDRATLPKSIDHKNDHVQLSNIDWDSRIEGYVSKSELLSSKLFFPDGYDEFYVSINKKRKKQIPAEAVIFNSFILIDVIEAMSSVAGIDFKFSTWSPRCIESFNGLDYSSYIPPKEFNKMNISTSNMADKWEKDILESKNLFSINNRDSDAAEIRRAVRPWEIFGVKGFDTCDHEPQTDLQDRFWVKALDNQHTGLHDQIHFAEHFIQKRISNDQLKLLPEVRIKPN